MPEGYSPALDRLKRAFQHAHRPEPARSEEDPPPLACPNCGEPMFPREWGIGSLVMVDVCIDCRGVWLEGEELTALERLFSFG
jgi:hypothetical protein